MAKRVEIEDSEYLKGIREVTAKLSAALEKLPDLSAEKLMAMGLDIQSQAQKLVPNDTGDLEGSAVTKLENEGDSPSVTIGFYTPYAANQHEHTEYEHKDGRKAKYLEKPLNDKLEDITAKLGEAVSEAFEG